MDDNLTTDKIGVLDPLGENINPLTGKEYSEEYRQLGSVWSKYPTFLRGEEILESLRDNQLTFIIAGTGAGKSVLVPKFALHYTNYQGKIGMTLPKRLVTYSTASFAAKTFDVELGKEIGFVYKGSEKNMAGPDNKILYMTDGFLIMKFIGDPMLSEFKVIIIDEAHERRVQIDLLMLFLKRLLKSGNRPDLRVVIMSATINGEKYQAYFSGVRSKIINISGQPNYEIETHFLDKPSKSYMDDGLELIENLIQRGIKRDMLFFITTSNEALQLCRSIRPKYPRVYCIEVYSDMDKNLKIYAESRDRYLELGNYDQKLIMATNVAESSLTIDGLKYVIDSGYELYTHFDPASYGKIFEKKLVTKAQALQRRGRIGRTEPGICYHLFTHEQFNQLQDYPTPDILKQDITMDIVKMMEISESKTLGEAEEMLSELMDPPKKSFVDVAKDLYQLYKIVDTDGKLTKIGSDLTQFSSLPLNQILFLEYAFQLYCAKEASIIIAMIEATNGKIGNLFFKGDTICESGCEKPSSRLFLEKMAQKRGDHLTLLKIYNEFKKADDQKVWTRKYGIKLDMLNNADKNVNRYYYKMVQLSRQPQNSRITTSNEFLGNERSSNERSGNERSGNERSAGETSKRILEALRLSHQHLTAYKLQPVFSKRDIEGQISRDSVLNIHYKRKDLAKKRIIYDEMVNINGGWEFTLVSII